MKKLVFLRENPNAFGGAELYLKWIKESIEKLGISSTVRGFDGKQKISSWIKALLFNNQAKKQKSDDELYFSLARIDSADIYRTDDGVHKIYRATKKLWFLNPLNFVYPYLEKKCFENSKCIIAISQMVKNQIIDCYKIDPKKIKVLYNGVEFPITLNKKKSKQELCNEFNLDFNIPLILFVGSGFKRKGVREILLTLKDINEPYNAIFVGKDKKIDYYKNLAKKFNVNAVFLGARNDVKRFFEASDIFMLLSIYEPFGLSILEAMSYQNAVISSKNCGASEILDPNFVATNNQQAKDILINLLHNPMLLENIADKNRQIAKNFTLENNVKETLKIIKDYLNND